MKNAKASAAAKVRHINQPFTDEAKRKISETKLANTAQPEDQKCNTCGEIFPRKFQNGRFESWAKYRSHQFCSRQCHWDSRQGHVDLTCQYCKKPFRVKKATFDKKNVRCCSRKCLGLAMRATGERKGAKHPMWNGGTTDKTMKDRNTAEYNEWRLIVYRRDYWTCQKCHEKLRAGNIVAHHIKGFHEYPQLRLVIDNGLTLCRPCHLQVHEEIRFRRKVA